LFGRPDLSACQIALRSRRLFRKDSAEGGGFTKIHESRLTGQQFILFSGVVFDGVVPDLA